jgi:large subunit ribosomal protein L4
VPEIKAPLFSIDGKEKGEVTLDSSIFGIEPNIPVIHQVVTAQLAGRRRGTHSTKTRAEVRGGGRKPWRQKGLGRARQGSIRAPHWVGGGIAHGPKPRDYSQRTPKKMKRLALNSALSARASESAVKVVEDFSWDAPKTKAAAQLLSQIGVEGKALVVLDKSDVNAQRAFRNIPTVRLAEAGHVTTYDVMWAEDLVFSTSTINSLANPAGFDVSDSDFVKEEATSTQGGDA